MGTVSKGLNKRTDKEEVSDLIRGHLKKGASANLITWVILGGMKFMAKEPVSTYDFLTASSKGITKQAVMNLANVMDVPMKDIATLLNMLFKTLGRKQKKDPLERLSSSLSIELPTPLLPVRRSLKIQRS